jgi:N-acetylglutamate synthase-like GNAT family acetyltransferase
VNLRSRLLSHLRNADEARMLRQTRRISHTRTAGEMGALLLEAQLIKQLKPMFNQKLRESRQCCSWQLIGPRPELVYSNDLDFAVAPHLYGLFGSRQAGLQALRDLADQHRLCYGALGLEKLAAGKACFRAAIRQCAGVCRGDETSEQHHERLLGSLQPWGIEPWPWGGAIAVIERDGMILACAALYPIPAGSDEIRSAEIACVAVDSSYRKSNRGSQILQFLESKAKQLGIQQLFVLTTRTAHWFLEQGFVPASVDDLPNARQALYNYQRNSLVFKKRLR